MIPKQKQAAHMLLGRTLTGGWRVVSKNDERPDKTGGVYSATYNVVNGEKMGFLKAFDYSSAAKAGRDSVEQLRDIMIAFSFEKDILERCLKYNCKNVIEILESGSVDVEEAIAYPRVEYIILEYAPEGDIRDLLLSDKINLEWKMRSLHQLALGLNELHKISIAHQDIKPSNIVSMGKGKTKLTDFGSAITVDGISSDLPSHLNKAFAGTWEYAPPELLYGELNTDPIIRRIGCDLYLLGSMIAFYFTGMSMTALIKQNLEDDLCWTNNSNYGNYHVTKSYIISAYEMALNDVESMIKDDFIKDKVVSMIRFLCNPDPLRRGHMANINEIGNNYNLERFISTFDLLAKRIKIKRMQQ